MIRIAVSAGDDRFTYDYEGDREIQVGRLKTADVPILHADISRAHCAIAPAREGDGFVVRDLESRNGVVVNGRRVERESPLEPGDEIRLGAVSLVFGRKAASPPAGDALAPALAEREKEPPPEPGKPPALSDRMQRLQQATLKRRLETLATFLGAIAVLGLVGLGVWKFAAPYLEAKKPAADGRGPVREAAPRATTPASAGDAPALTPPASQREREARERDAAARPARARSEPAGPATTTLEREAERLLRSGEFDQAHVLATLLADLAGDDETAVARAAELARRVEMAAYARFGEAREQARRLAAEGRLLEALDLVVREGGRVRRCGFAAEVDAEVAAQRRACEAAIASADAVARAAVDAGKKADRSALERLGPEATRALLALDFETAIARYLAVLDLPLTEHERVEYQWRLFDARRGRGLFRLLLDRIVDSQQGRAPKLRMTVAQSIQADVEDGDAEKVFLRARVAGERDRPEIRKKWRELAPAQILEILSQLDLDAEGLLALAAFALAADDDAAFHAALIACHERFPAFQAEALALLRRRVGPEHASGRLVAFEGRLVPIAERDRALAARQAAKAEARRRVEELDLAKKVEQGLKVYEAALRLLDQGHYLEGRDVLSAIVQRLKGTEPGELAAARLADPFLRRRPIAVTGRDDNRLTFYIIAEGYIVDDDAQKAFDRSADQASRTLLRAEPFREYAGYVNVYAVNVGSKDAGVDREPGGIQRDTALDGAVRDGTFTVSNAKARAFCDRFPGRSQAIAVGNDNATVATGGGGVAAVVKGMLDAVPHEVGHALAGLGDEYDFDPSGRNPPGGGRATGPLETQVIAPNLVRGNDRDDLRRKAPWAHWIAIGPANWTGRNVDLFEGGDRTPFDVWRPQVDCRMRTSLSEFCCVCMERMTLAIYGAVRPIDEWAPKEEKFEARAGQALVFRIAALRPKTRPLEVRWTVTELVDEAAGAVSTPRPDKKPRQSAGRVVEAPDGRVVCALPIGETELRPGVYEVKVELADPTPWVAQADRSALIDERRWTLRVRD